MTYYSEKYRDTDHERRRIRKLNRLCPNCATPPQPDRTMCEKCLTGARKRAQKARGIRVVTRVQDEPSKRYKARVRELPAPLGGTPAYQSEPSER